MFLQQRSTGNLIQMMRIEDLFDPCLNEVMGRCHAGQEMQDPAVYSKTDLMFPSGESLPRCWLDANYRQSMGSAQKAVKVAQ